MLSVHSDTARIAMGSFLFDLPLPYADDRQGSDSESDQLLAVGAHDLKSPLNIIRGISSALYCVLHQNDVEIDKAEILQDLEMILNVSKGMAQLIDGLLASARIESGKEVLDMLPIVDLPSVLSAVVETFRIEAKHNGIALHARIETPMPTVYWDLCKIQYHVLNNIFANALKYTPAGGAVELRARAQAESVIVEIADNGPGIPEADREKIFHRFERLNVKAARAYHSAGLGLYSAHLLTRLHDGKIDVGPGIGGQGATFTLTLPIRPSAIAATA